MDGVGEGIIGGNNLQPLWFKEDHADSACQRKQIDGDDRRAEDDGLLPLKKSPDSDTQPAAEQRAKRDDEEGAQPMAAPPTSMATPRMVVVTKPASAFPIMMS